MAWFVATDRAWAGWEWGGKFLTHGQHRLFLASSLLLLQDEGNTDLETRRLGPGLSAPRLEALPGLGTTNPNHLYCSWSPWWRCKRQLGPLWTWASESLLPLVSGGLNRSGRPPAAVQRKLVSGSRQGQPGVSWATGPPPATARAPGHAPLRSSPRAGGILGCAAVWDAVGFLLFICSVSATQQGRLAHYMD